ncbi:MAG: hypothetical protein ABJE66_02045 [Deltaproteobacteria bacterium]
MFLLILVVAGCGGGHQAKTDASVDAALDAAIDAPVDAPLAPVFRNPVTLDDQTLATKALQLIGANVSGAQTASCNSCHTLTRQHIRYWRGLGDTAMASCLTDLTVQSAQSAKQMLDCLRLNPANGDSAFVTQKLGIYASAGRLPWFDYTFKVAYGANATTELSTFITTAAMPHGSTVTPFTQPQFDIVAEWFARGLPLLDETLPEDPPPSTCDQSISADVATHVTAMATQGWRAVNRDNLLAMYDCGTATDPKNCLADLPRAADVADSATWDAGGSHIRLLKTITAYQSSYWTRSSADGRFVAHGGGSGSMGTVQDLQRGVAVGVPAPYDPGFFPDNSGWMFQGNGNNSCSMAVLTSLTGAANSLTMTEPGCTKLGEVGLYQHVGKVLGGGDYFAINGAFFSDNGGWFSSQDPGVSADSFTTANFTPMIFDGQTYVEKQAVSVAQPFEGDAVLSPSARVELTRVAGPGGQLGYVLHKVMATPAGATYTITTPEIARYCLAGGKPGFSYDERWIVYHHYTSDRADLYLMDLRTGVPIQITHMGAGQYALFPHFRSDGWIYADVREPAQTREILIASDAALLLE